MRIIWHLIRLTVTRVSAHLKLVTWYQRPWSKPDYLLNLIISMANHMCTWKIIPESLGGTPIERTRLVGDMHWFIQYNNNYLIKNTICIIWHNIRLTPTQMSAHSWGISHLISKTVKQSWIFVWFNNQYGNSYIYMKDNPRGLGGFPYQAHAPCWGYVLIHTR